MKTLMSCDEVELWKYGSVESTLINLEFIDTFRIDKPGHVHKENKWRSALEVVVNHEIGAFHDGLFYRVYMSSPQ